MELLFLEDLKGYTEDEVKQHISEKYTGDGDGESSSGLPKQDKEVVQRALQELDIIIAYESVGVYGCDSTSFFLFRRKSDGMYLENHGSHCSCWGFEGQFNPEETTIEYLKSDKFCFLCGGWDDNRIENQEVVKTFISEL